MSGERAGAAGQPGRERPEAGGRGEGSGAAGRAPGASALMLATGIAKRPVVTLGGEAVAQVRDIVFDSGGGHIVGFTLSGRRRLSGPMKRSLPWEGVYALGHDAVMIENEDALEDPGEVVERTEAKGGDVLESRVLTDGGKDVGKIVDVVVQAGTTADVVGYEIEPGDARGRHPRTAFLPRAETISVSGEALVIPALATEFMADDLPGFEAQVRAFRDRMRKGAD
ncbi:PRC-barrel domain-containing protein [Streptomyces pathocidini]|uniref:PRC-barrel domain-containing protein n=1 Tax=Streptomyces pathocidini TaxID=1650571 RepID=UPI0033CE9B64